MFLTVPQYELEVPEPLAGPEDHHWGAVDLCVDVPWFVFTYAVDYGPVKLRRTSAVTWEPMLVELIALVRPELRGGLALLAKSDEQREPWRLRWVEELWAAKEQESSGEKLLLRLVGEKCLRAASLQRVAKQRGYTLVYERPRHSALSERQAPREREF